jgi:hypothetical protein
MVLPGIAHHVTQRGDRRERTFLKMPIMHFTLIFWPRRRIGMMLKSKFR